MATEAVPHKIHRIVVEMAPISVHSINEDTSLAIDLGFDSLRLVELATALEDAFDLPEASEDDLADIDTVGDAVGLVRRLLAQKPNQAATRGPEGT